MSTYKLFFVNFAVFFLENFSETIWYIRLKFLQITEIVILFQYSGI